MLAELGWETCAGLGDHLVGVSPDFPLLLGPEPPEPSDNSLPCYIYGVSVVLVMLCLKSNFRHFYHMRLVCVPTGAI